ncbi:MAG: ATP-binding protein [Eggerthellaceae bacterium]|nr:ATP-binding protein [Eggerthellaceae bacterium]
MRNSRDAHCSNAYVAIWRLQNLRHITVIDDGDGIPSKMHDLVFEPRVTSKLDTSHIDAWGLHGRGMALYSIATNAKSARVVNSDTHKGCAIEVCADLNRLPEKADQSSFPTFELGENGVVNVRGPKNLLRTICEFALQSRSQCNVYVGSPAEICASLYTNGVHDLSVVERLFCDDIMSLPVTKRLAVCSTPSEFAEQAASLGLPISDRTARRILDETIKDVPKILDRITLTSPADKSKPKKKRTSRNGSIFKLTEDEKKMLADSAMAGFSSVAPAYYLNTSVEPEVVVNSDRLVVSIPLVRL